MLLLAAVVGGARAPLPWMGPCPRTAGECQHQHGKYQWHTELESNVGTPDDTACKEVSGGVFERKWSEGVVRMDCNRWEGEFAGVNAPLKSDDGAVSAALVVAPSPSAASSPATVPLYRLFEMRVTNTNTSAANKYRDVWLNATFSEPSPSGRRIQFYGFYDGAGSLWKLRFMPNVTGRWSFRYSFSDGSMGGDGEFVCAAEGRSPGVMMPLAENPRWFSYGGDAPVFIKSYYVKAGGITRQPVDWVAKNVYQKMIDRGYNHHMSSGFLPVLPLTGEPWPTAAITMENPYCGCKLTAAWLTAAWDGQP